MQNKQTGLTQCPVNLPRRDIAVMVRFVRTMYHLSQLPTYHKLMTKKRPTIACFDPKHDAVMMGYDFHLTDIGPQLIEINTNAGGGFLAFRANYPHVSEDELPSKKIQKTVLKMFAQEMQQFSNAIKEKPSLIAIVDEKPENQFFFPEIKAYAQIFKNWGVPTAIVDPSELSIKNVHLFLGEKPVDMIYNRHCDFYLENSVMDNIKSAYLARTVCLTPNPIVYGLLADKRCMVIWSNLETLLKLGVNKTIANFITSVVPASFMLSDLDAEKIWSQRRQWVFKPVNKYGSRGVIIGNSLRKNRFSTLPPNETLVQRLVKPSLTECEGYDKPLKTDIRLFAYRDKILGIGARLYYGQVTNFKERGSGYAPVCII
ncbi:hypothetical protein [Candidatus Parabeggiatoa sp. HSG14]|uniref:hypothetical protein n=1 Tax=Candidatus Parabeggiatoa sp. HSG14 TaxID=3055593 RepID=UPI0025A8FF07|nr:hypothetical protein [Thiotrichales bacterium HSG14]